MSALILDQITDPFLSLTALREAHWELLRRRREESDPADFIDAIQTFLFRAQAAGAYLDLDEERAAAQSLLDYWENQLYHSGLQPPEAILAEFDPALQPELPDHLSPYVGLNAFQEDEQHLFYGRQQLIQELLNKVNSQRLLALVGPSGSGKSSAVLAGLLPKLRSGALPDSQHWRYYPPIVPGSTPLIQLARALERPDVSITAWLAQHLERFRENPGHLAELANEAGQGPAVFVVDQLEEVFALCHDREEREAFLNNLVALVQAPEERHVVIVTMRTDYESYLNQTATFQMLFDQGTVRVTAMNAAELREAIERPAQAIGLKFEEGLVDELIREILGEPAALPLLQFALLQLWEQRDHNRITWEAYRRLGGVMKALANTADALYEGLLLEEQVTAKRIILRIVRPSEGLEVTRNRIRRKTLYLAGEAEDRVDRVLDKLVQANLLHLTTGNSPDDDQVEVAHEALVRNWPRLVEWLDEERMTLRQRLRLASQAEHWQLKERDRAALLRGALLQEALQYDDLNQLESEFVEASKAAVLQEEQEKEEARQRELQQARALAEEQRQRAEAQAVAARRLRYFNLALVLVFLFMIGVVLLWVNNSQLQTRSAETANRATGEALVAQEQALVATQTASIVQLTSAAEIAISRGQAEARGTADAAGTAQAIGVIATATFQAAVAIQTQTAHDMQATVIAQGPTSDEPVATPTLSPELMMAQFPVEAQVRALIRERDNVPMLFITGGTFNMGAAQDDPDAQVDELPQHEVTLNSFYLDQYEVTVKQYAAFLNSRGDYRGCGGGRFDCVLTGVQTRFTYLLNNLGVYEPKVGFENYPVNWVSWYGANDYCQWVGARLPTEAEWEYAARGLDERRYPWANEPPDRSRAVFNRATVQDRFSEAMLPVNALPDGVSPFGIYNMAGSVWEWVQDWYDPNYYSSRPGAAPNEDNTSGRRVLRGGSWEGPAALIRTTARHSLEPENRPRTGLFYWDVGFRCARDVQ